LTAAARWSNALLDGRVTATIYNGMDLLSLSADIQYMVTAMVLLATVTGEAPFRRGPGVYRRRRVRSS
jgi:ABC-type xylose transport system permease subunit